MPFGTDCGGAFKETPALCVTHEMGEAGGEAVEMHHQEAGSAGHRGQDKAQGGHGAGMSCNKRPVCICRP